MFLFAFDRCNSDDWFSNCYLNIFCFVWYNMFTYRKHVFRLIRLMVSTKLMHAVLKYLSVHGFSLFCKVFDTLFTVYNWYVINVTILVYLFDAFRSIILRYVVFILAGNH